MCVTFTLTMIINFNIKWLSYLNKCFVYIITFKWYPSPTPNFLMHSEAQEGSSQHEATATFVSAHFGLVFKSCIIFRTSAIWKNMKNIIMQLYLIYNSHLSIMSLPNYIFVFKRIDAVLDLIPAFCI